MRQDFTQKAFGLWAWDAEPTRKIPVELSAALPEKVVMLGPVRLVDQSPVRVSGHLPAVVIGWIGIGEFPLIVKADRNVGWLLWIEIDHRFCGIGIVSEKRITAGVGHIT